MKKLLFLFILPMLLAASCNKDEPENPYKNVVRCKINGVPWEAQCEGNIVFGCQEVDCLNGINELDIYSINSKSNESLRILFDNPKKQLKAESKFVKGNKVDDCKAFGINMNSFHELIIIENDTTNKGDRLGTLIGSFHFTVANTCGDTVRITDGYFRTSYR